MATSLHSTIPTARYLTFLARTVCHHQVPALPFITLLGRVSCSGLMAGSERAVLHQEYSCTHIKQQQRRARHEKSTSETHRHQDNVIQTPNNPKQPLSSQRDYAGLVKKNVKQASCEDDLKITDFALFVYSFFWCSYVKAILTKTALQFDTALHQGFKMQYCKCVSDTTMHILG